MRSLALGLLIGATTIALGLGCGGRDDILPYNGTSTTNGSGGTGGTAATNSTTDGSTVVSTTTSMSISVSTTTGPVSSSIMVSSSTGGPVCGDNGDCEQCATCAQNPGGDCYTEVEACFGNPQCLDFVDCISNCQSQQCQGQCFNDNPAGAQLYQDALFCIVCDTCPVSCDGGQQGCPEL